jgi:hypothetical protein
LSFFFFCYSVPIKIYTGCIVLLYGEGGKNLIIIIYRYSFVLIVYLFDSNNYIATRRQNSLLFCHAFFFICCKAWLRTRFSLAFTEKVHLNYIFRILEWIDSSSYNSFVLLLEMLLLYFMCDSILNALFLLPIFSRFLFSQGQ